MDNSSNLLAQKLKKVFENLLISGDLVSSLWVAYSQAST